MEGGRDWWQQITEALNVVEFMLLVMTPAATGSEMVRKEWRYARQQGVCVYPVKGAPDLDFTSLPHWMRSAHFYDLAHEWPKLLNDLNTRCQQPRVPFMVEDLPADYVPRPREFEALIEKLLDQRREEPVAITAALRGAGGYGKTTMAKALCHDDLVQDAICAAHRGMTQSVVGRIKGRHANMWASRGMQLQQGATEMNLLGARERVFSQLGGAAAMQQDWPRARLFSEREVPASVVQP